MTFHCFVTHEANIQILVVYLFVHAFVHIFFNTHTNAAWSNGSFSLFFLPPSHTSFLVFLLFDLFCSTLFFFFFYIFVLLPLFLFLCHSKLELIRLTSQISHRLVAHFISISAMWLHPKFSSPPHPIDLHPQPPPFPLCLPLIYQTFRIGASRNLLHTRALPGNLMCCFAFSVFIRGKWVLKLVTF